VMRAIAEILWDPNVRMLIASKSHVNAVGMLTEIAGYFKYEKFQDVFGDMTKSDKWDTYAINVSNRTIIAKEHTIDTTGVETALPSRHWDRLFVDDVCDEPTSRTKGQREKLHTWYYKTLDPCLMPEGKKVVQGTRYHHEDLYTELEDGEMEGKTLILPIEDKEGRPADPERFPSEWIESKRKNAGRAIFDSQYMLNCDRMATSPFEWEGLSNYYNYRNVEGSKAIVRDGNQIMVKKLLVVQGVDPATGTVGVGGSYFSHVTVGIDPDAFIYILDYYFGRIPFHKQMSMISGYCKEWNAVAVGVESNAYQKVLVDSLRHEDARVPALSQSTQFTHS